ncbi:MAG: hypothetical protein DMG31_18180 [Acidobacteria bacterium]|nr:MAG: hypothetical protein DMG31_18180 [Acidobacteriota bacterium]
MREHQPQKNGRPLPPVETRWKKGASGNPRGRPKKQDCLSQLLREEIQKICPADREKRTWKQLIVFATLQLAMKGNPTALKEVWERLDGKVLQSEKLQLGGVGGKHITIEVVYAEQPNESRTAQTKPSRNSDA